MQRRHVSIGSTYVGPVACIHIRCSCPSTINTYHWQCDYAVVIMVICTFTLTCCVILATLPGTKRFASWWIYLVGKPPILTFYSLSAVLHPQVLPVVFFVCMLALHGMPFVAPVKLHMCVPYPAYYLLSDVGLPECPVHIGSFASQRFHFMSPCCSLQYSCNDTAAYSRPTVPKQAVHVHPVGHADGLSVTLQAGDEGIDGCECVIQAWNAQVMCVCRVRCSFKLILYVHNVCDAQRQIAGTPRKSTNKHLRTFGRCPSGLFAKQRPRYNTEF